jgi:hypothetical protein
MDAKFLTPKGPVAALFLLCFDFADFAAKFFRKIPVSPIVARGCRLSGPHLARHARRDLIRSGSG